MWGRMRERVYDGEGIRMELSAHLPPETLLLGFDVPWHVGLAMRAEDMVVHVAVHVLGIDQGSVDVEDTGPDRREGGSTAGHRSRDSNRGFGTCVESYNLS